MSDLPTALRLADELAAEIQRTVQVDMLHHTAAVELRRLHAENEVQAARIAADEALMRQALAQMEANQYAVADTAPHRDVMAYNGAIEALRNRLEAPC